MNTDKNDEPVLPLTPTNEGRQPSVNNFGYNLPFDELWAVGLGLLVSVVISLSWMAGLFPGPWYIKIMVTVIPALGGHIYTKTWIEGALPHVQRDMIARFLTLRPDFEHPRWKRFPYLPSFRPELVMAGDPEPADGGGHPLQRMRQMDAKSRRRRRSAE